MLVHFSLKVQLTDLARLPARCSSCRSICNPSVRGSFFGVVLHVHEDECLGVPSHSRDVVLCFMLQGQAFEMFKFEFWLVFVNICKRILLKLFKLRQTAIVLMIPGATHRRNLRLLSERDLFSHVTIFVFSRRCVKEVWSAVDLLD